MTLKVEPAELRNFSRDLQNVADAAEEAIDYAAHTRPHNADHEAHVFVQFVNNIAPVRPAVIDLFSHLRKLSMLSHDELVDAAHYYVETDAAQAERADTHYRAVADTLVPTRGGAA